MGSHKECVWSDKLRLRPLPPLDSLNCYFAGLVSDCTVSHIPPCGPANESHFTAFSPVSLGYIQKLLEQLDTCKAPGSDELLPSLLRSCAGTLAPSFTHHVNKSLSCGVFPAGFKNANITPFSSLQNWMPLSPVTTEAYPFCQWHLSSWRK